MQMPWSVLSPEAMLMSKGFAVSLLVLNMATAGEVVPPLSSYHKVVPSMAWARESWPRWHGLWRTDPGGLGLGEAAKP